MSSPRDLEEAGFGWRESGEGGPAVVFLHGLGGSRLAWEPQLGAFGVCRRAVAWDQPGYGASAPLEPTTTFAGLADALARFLDLLGLDRVHFVGLSFGGMVAQHAALAHGDRLASLTLLSSSPAFGLDGTTAEAWRSARLAPLDAGRTPGDFAGEVLTAIAGPGLTPEALAAQKAAMARIGSDGLRAAIDCLVTHDTRAELHRIAVPTLVLAGALDEETPVAYAQALAGGIPGARLEVVEGAGHLLGAEAPDAVNAIVAGHLDAVEALA
ncbi:alpha/beta fold hydrolase [Capillimicrobium parvum]|uniref:alpha/beta fold hydrolase n=1 Tax=Capillimicrobium parvum TaxID=2884022 RepID=UPI00216B07DF|nr:alpha/beta hydrolase [Capillimicrobium parvum]